MEKQQSALNKSVNTVKGMFEFFYSEFETLRAKTGIRQFEQLNEQPDSAKAIHDIIDLMCKECEKEPFHIVRPEVKQRVISRAIVEDPDFIGLNARFVNRTMYKWWASNKDRILEAVNKPEEAPRVELTDEQKRKIDRLANEYVAQLLQGDGMQRVPKVDPATAKVEGKEWTSDLERKAIQYPITTVEQAMEQELHREWARTNFDIRTGHKLPTWKPEQEWIDSLSEDQKKEIYKRAVK